MNALQMIIDLDRSQYRIVKPGRPARLIVWLIAAITALGPALVATAVATVNRIDRARWPAWLTYRVLSLVAIEAGQQAAQWLAGQTLDRSLRGVAA